MNQHRYSSVRLLIICVIVAITAGTASAQVFSIEGKINAIDTAARTITVMDTVVAIPADLTVTTPTGSLELTAFDPATGPSLVGAATAIITGSRDAAGANVADDVFIEIAENVMVGTIDAVDGTELIVNGGARVRINAPGSGVGDSRFEAVVYPSAGFTVFSETGYPVALPATDGSVTNCVPNPNIAEAVMPIDSTKPCAISAGELLSAEGDFRSDGTSSYLAAHTLEAGKLVLYNPANVAGGVDYVSTLGNAVIDGNEISLRGFGTFAGGRVFLYRSNSDCTIGTAVVNGNGVRISALMGTDSGVFRFDKTRFAGSSAFTHIVARTSNGATACPGVELDD